MVRANEMQRDELAAFLGTDEGAAFLKATDAKWSEAIEPMREAGFIAQAAGGVAVAMTYANMVEAQGLEGAARMLQMNGVEMPAGANETAPDGRQA